MVGIHRKYVEEMKRWSLSKWELEKEEEPLDDNPSRSPLCIHSHQFGFTNLSHWILRVFGKMLLVSTPVVLHHPRQNPHWLLCHPFPCKVETHTLSLLCPDLLFVNYFANIPLFYFTNLSLSKFHQYSPLFLAF